MANSNVRRSRIVPVAREKLQRWGFNPSRQCCLLSYTDIDQVLVRLPGQDEVFPCVDFRDRLHGMFIFLWRVITETINKMSIENKTRRLLDQRLEAVCNRRCFRSETGQAYRKQKSIFEGAGMTAADKICLIFLLPHVLGHKADCLEQDLTDPLLTAIGHAQLMLIAVRGQCSYTKPELETIFDRGYLVVFGALERMRARDFSKRMQGHRENPDKCPPPKRFKRQTRHD